MLPLNSSVELGVKPEPTILIGCGEIEIGRIEGEIAVMNGAVDDDERLNVMLCDGVVEISVEVIGMENGEV